MTKRLLSILTVCFLIFGFTGCKKEKNDSSESSDISSYSSDFPVTAALVTLESCPKRVISLSPSITSAIKEIDCTSQLVGVCNSSNLITELPRLGSASLPDITKLLSLSPDLVLTNSALPENIADKLAFEEVPVAVIPNAKSFEGLEEYYHTISLLLKGRETGPENAQTAIEILKNKLNLIRESTSEGIGICLFLADGVVATGDSFVGELLSRTGARNIAEDFTDYFMSYEEIADKNPDYIFCPTELRANISANELLKSTFAVKNERVVGIDVTDLEMQGSEMCEMLEYIYTIINYDLKQT